MVDFHRTALSHGRIVETRKWNPGKLLRDQVSGLPYTGSIRGDSPRRQYRTSVYPKSKNTARAITAFRLMQTR